MRWPPNKAWTSSTTRAGYRHFELMKFGGKKQERWVELFAVNNKKVRILVSLKELMTPGKWSSGWIQLEEVQSEQT